MLQSFSKPLPIAIVVLGFAIAFVSMTQVIKQIDVGLAYAIGAGMGIVIVTIVAWVLCDQRSTALSLIGLVAIVTGATAISSSGSRPG